MKPPSPFRKAWIRTARRNAPGWAWLPARRTFRQFLFFDRESLYRLTHLLVVLIDREKRIGLRFPVRLAEFLLDAIYRVEEEAPRHAQPGAAEFPIGSEQEMVAKELEFLRFKMAFRDEHEIGRELLILAVVGNSRLS